MLTARRTKNKGKNSFGLVSVEYNVESPRGQGIVTPWAAVVLKLVVKAYVRYISSSLKSNA